MKTGIVLFAAAVVAALGAFLARGGTPAPDPQPAGPASYAASDVLGCAFYPSGGPRAWMDGPCTDATGSAMMGQPDAYRITVANTGDRAEPVPDVTVGFYGIFGTLIATAREILPAGWIAPHHIVREVEQDQLPGTVVVRVLGTSKR